MTLIMGSPKLRELTRGELQSLAKREVVRAVGKTEDIIRRLMQKHPKGVPVSEYAENPSASSEPSKLGVPKKSGRSTPPNPEPSKCQSVSKGETAPVIASPLPSSSTEALKLLRPEDQPVAGLSDTNPESSSSSHPRIVESGAPIDHYNPGPSLSGKQHPSHQAHNEGHDARSIASPLEVPNPDPQTNVEEEFDEDDYPKGAPTHYMVVDTLRQFTRLVNTIPPIETRIAESRCLLKRTETLLEKATPDARELTVTREYLETFFLAKMKKKRELWDGTGKMKKEVRRHRMEWLRAERKAENEKRWKEANELNRQHGFEPEPFLAFASESDEDIIESLQTTPASSRSGSCKRSREESDMESDRDTDTNGESRRKTARM